MDLFSHTIGVQGAAGPLSFSVYGQPAPGGSKRAFPNRKTGRIIITEDSKHSRPWRALVTDAAVQAMGERPLLTGPLRVEFRFQLPRPKGHHGKRGVRPSAPRYPAVRPDLLKYARLAEDSLTGIIWVDDALIVEEHLYKNYGDLEPVCMRVAVTPL